MIFPQSLHVLASRELAWDSSAVPLEAGRHLLIPTGHYLPRLLSSLTDYRATSASGVYGGAGRAIVPVPLLRTASAPTSGSAGRTAGVAYPTLKVHELPTATGLVQVFAVTEYSVPMLTSRFSAVIVKGAVPVLVTVTTLGTAARGLGRRHPNYRSHRGS